MRITLHKVLKGNVPTFELRGLTNADCLLMALVMKSSRSEIASSLDDLRNPTIKAIMENGNQLSNQADRVEAMNERITEILSVLNSTPQK